MNWAEMGSQHTMAWLDSAILGSGDGCSGRGGSIGRLKFSCLELSEEIVVNAAYETRVWVNYALSIAHDIAIGGNMKLFSRIVVGLWLISYVGSLFDFLTLVYIYRNLIDDKLNAVYRIAQIQYNVIEEKLLSKIPLLSNKEKKIQ
ncbi:hypothetical protein OROMI_007200 [Orobanche minor]